MMKALWFDNVFKFNELLGTNKFSDVLWGIEITH